MNQYQLYYFKAKTCMLYMYIHDSAFLSFLSTKHRPEVKNSSPGEWNADAQEMECRPCMRSVLSCIVEGRGEKKKASETRFLALPQYMPGLALALFAREDGVGPDSAGLDPLPLLIEGKLTAGKFLKQ